MSEKREMDWQKAAGTALVGVLARVARGESVDVRRVEDVMWLTIAAWAVEDRKRKR